MKRSNRQTIVHMTQHRKRKNKQHEPHQKLGVIMNHQIKLIRLLVLTLSTRRIENMDKDIQTLPEHIKLRNYVYYFVLYFLRFSMLWQVRIVFNFWRLLFLVVYFVFLLIKNIFIIIGVYYELVISLYWVVNYLCTRSMNSQCTFHSNLYCYVITSHDVCVWYVYTSNTWTSIVLVSFLTWNCVLCFLIHREEFLHIE